MIHALICSLILSQTAGRDSPPEYVSKYLKRCDEHRSALIRAQQERIALLAAELRPDAAADKKLRAARDELKRLQEQPPPRAPLPLPPAKDDIGVFARVAKSNGRTVRSVNVLEVVDASNAIVRAWYPPQFVPQDPAAPEDDTFVDLWVQGIDTCGLAVGSPAKLTEVFHVSGSKLIDTTCGKRSLPLLQPIEIETFRRREQSQPRESSR